MTTTTLDQDGTSAGRSTLATPIVMIALGSQMLFGGGTSSGSIAPVGQVAAAALAQEETSAGPAAMVRTEHATAVLELRSLSGLSWEQLARLFGVSRRAAHLWAAGNPMSAANEEHLYRCLAVLRRADRGGSAFNRAALFRADRDGASPFDLLAGRTYDVALVALGIGRSRRVVPAPSAEERARRLPPAPGEMMGAIHGKAGIEIPGGRAGKNVKVRGERKDDRRRAGC